jgi:predicted kinase
MVYTSQMLIPRKIPLLSLVGGLPCAGKTTLSKIIAAETGATRICPDEMMAAEQINLKNNIARRKVEKAAVELAKLLLARDTDVILELALWKRTERDAMRELAHAQGARVALHFLDASTDVLLERLQLRNTHAGADIGYVSEAELTSWAVMVEPPTLEEKNLFD